MGLFFILLLLFVIQWQGMQHNLMFSFCSLVFFSVASSVRDLRFHRIRSVSFRPWNKYIFLDNSPQSSAPKLHWTVKWIRKICMKLKEWIQNLNARVKKVSHRRCVPAMKCTRGFQISDFSGPEMNSVSNTRADFYPFKFTQPLRPPDKWIIPNDFAARKGN